jgi:putative endonuclease
MEPGVQRKSRVAQKDFVPLSRLVMCWVPDRVPLALHPSGNRPLGKTRPCDKTGRMDRYWVYMLASQQNGTLYIGVTNDIVRRVNEHKSKAFAGFTARYNVCILVWHEEHSSILDAQAREKTLKKWRRAWKLALIEHMNPGWADLHEHLM